MRTNLVQLILKSTWFRHACAAVAYSLAFIFLTWPLVPSMGTSVLGFYKSDAPLFLWNAWEWQHKFSIGDFSYYTQDIFYPNTVSILLHTHTLVQSVFVVALNAGIRNLVFSFNVVYWLSAVAGAFFTYLFFLKKTKNYFAALLAGQFFGFQHLWAVYSLFGTQNIISFWYIPAVLCAFAYFEERRHKRYLVIAGIVLGLAFLNDFTMFAFASTALGAYGLVTQIVTKQHWKEVVVQWACVLLSFVLVAGWNIGYIFGHAQEIGRSAVPSVADVDFYHADPINLIRPSQYHVVWPELNSAFTTAARSQGNDFVGFTIFFIFLVLLLVWARTRQAPERKPFVVYGGLFLLFTLLSFGPYLHLAGLRTSLTMPYWFIGKILPQFNNFRVPLRWLFPGMFFFAGGIAFSLQYIFEKISTRAMVFLSLVFFSGLVLDSWLGPKQLLVVDAYPQVREQITAQPGVVMELPLAISSGFFTPAEGARVSEIHQVMHGQPIVDGIISRAPQGFIESYEREPVTKYLVLYKTSQPDVADRDTKNIQTFLARYAVRYILFDKHLGTRDDFSGKNLVAFITARLKFSQFYEDDAVIAFKR